MSAPAIDTIARGAATTTRRASLASLAGLMAAAVAAPAAGKRGRKRKRNRKKSRRKSEDLCQKQVEQCRTALIDGCAKVGCDGTEVDAIPCCQSFSVCDAGQAIACLFAV